MEDLGTYGNDSFFTLTGGEQMGLAILSVLLWGLAIWVVCRLVRGPFQSALLGFGVFVLFVWLSPQVYYLYYQVIFEGLPWQVVVKTPPTPGYLVRLLLFWEESSLSRHGQGVLGWSLMITGLIRGLRRDRRPAP